VCTDSLLLPVSSCACPLAHLPPFPTRRSSDLRDRGAPADAGRLPGGAGLDGRRAEHTRRNNGTGDGEIAGVVGPQVMAVEAAFLDRKSTPLHSSHVSTTYSVS